ncbi:uncharacterized protein LOC125006666 [Mugil cephalus]|uniref:uncharacterized protein LOC125006666 n=1 Tax=Mugil cephalus TaxID=48193 RepID=UPI001FB74ECD|nr:uncharacterized protein LOC125006666 [Mugil cephalus]
MDDLDHSIHISEYDWTSFYEECEECDLLQALLACPDDASLSDSETSEDSVFSAGWQETQQRPDATSGRAERGAAGRPTEQESAVCLELSVQLNQSGTRGRGEEAATKPEEGNTSHEEIRLDCSGGNTISTEEVCVKAAEDTKEEETSIIVTNTLQIESVNDQNSGESDKLAKDGGVQAESGLKATEEPDLLSRNQTGLSVKDAGTTERAVREDESGASLRAEKERWFVTMSVSPARQRKKKLRQKKTCEGDKNSGDKRKPERRKDTQFKQKKSVNAEILQLGVISGSTQTASTSSELDTSSTQMKTTHPPNEPSTEPRVDGRSEPTSPDTFGEVESVESDELVENADFFSVHSYDSESYLSAAESVEEPQRLLHEPLTTKQQLGCSLSLTHVFGLTENTDAERTRDDDGALSGNATAPNCEAYESAGAEPSLTFPSAAQAATTTPDDSPTRGDDAHSALLYTPSDTTGPHKHNMNLSECGWSREDELSPPPVPDLMITPCSEADSPETFAQATGQTRPVYAISAFWDEMEKLTINDILQLKMGSSTPSRETQGAATPNADAAPANLSPLLDSGEYDTSDSALMDTSDAADSDYYTQTDDSKPDHSSCDFSTSDFEEEYWHFISASRNPSPDPDSKRRQSRNDSLLSRDLESTSSEGKETPVPSEENFDEQCSDDQEIHTRTSGEPPSPRGLTKSKSMHNVKALHREGFLLSSLLGSDESSLLLSCKPLEENTILKMSDTLGTPTSSSTGLIDSHYQISFPEVFEYFFTEDKANTESLCVTIYDPENISVAPAFEDTLCTRRDECSLYCTDEKPIPIFSCSHPTVRELTLPKADRVFLRSNCEGVEDVSPFRVVSHSFIRADQWRYATAVGGGGPHGWKSLLALRKIRFQDKGSIWYRSSGGWGPPVESRGVLTRREDAAVFSGGRVRPVSSLVVAELEEQQRLLESVWTPKREGIFSTLKQADMCLVCIAFASWVLRSSDPDAADTWKAALLANVSALSAIQYLRQYVKKTTPPRDEP